MLMAFLFVAFFVFFMRRWDDFFFFQKIKFKKILFFVC
jgi:hypothetical protein